MATQIRLALKAQLQQSIPWYCGFHGPFLADWFGQFGKNLLLEYCHSVYPCYIAPWSFLHQIYLSDVVKFAPGSLQIAMIGGNFFLMIGINHHNLYVGNLEVTGRVLKHEIC